MLMSLNFSDENGVPKQGFRNEKFIWFRNEKFIWFGNERLAVFWNEKLEDYIISEEKEVLFSACKKFYS